MSLTQLVADLKASIQDAATAFTAAGDADFRRHLAAASHRLGRKRPRAMAGALALVADQAQYTAPAGFIAYQSHLWGLAPRRAPAPWEPGYPGRLPHVRAIETSANPVTVMLHLDPPPTAAQIAVLGAEFRFYYRGAHAIDNDASKTTVRPDDRGLLLLAAQAEAMRELAMRNVTKPMMVREGLSSTPRNGSPTYLYEKFLEEFQAAA